VQLLLVAQLLGYLMEIQEVLSKMDFLQPLEK